MSKNGEKKQKKKTNTLPTKQKNVMIEWNNLGPKGIKLSKYYSNMNY